MERNLRGWGWKDESLLKRDGESRVTVFPPKKVFLRYR